MICPVTAVLPAHDRVEPTLKTLAVLYGCVPCPAEIIVHVDGGSHRLVAAIRGLFPEVLVLTSDVLLGPGGGRNRLIAAASHELVANFDDDSFPEFPDYFARVVALAQRFPEAAMFSASSMDSERSREDCQVIAVASGCGCVFRKSWFERTAGFVPLVVAYAMEEVDVCLQLFALGGLVVHDPELRVVHEKEYPKMMEPKLNALVTANTVLLPFLRYPVWLWPLGLVQVISRLQVVLRWGWSRGLLRGVLMAPAYLWRYRKYRKVVSGEALLRWFLLKREVVSLGRV